MRIRSAPYHPPSDIISVETNLVELAVTVRDRKDVPIAGLRASDFALFDNSKPQKITFFSEEDAPPPAAVASVTAVPPNSGVAAPPPAPVSPVRPRFIALFFDNTHAGLAGFERSRLAARKLIKESLQPGDRIGIYTSAGDVEQDFTSDGRVLLAAIDKIHRHPSPGVAGGINKCPTLTVYQSYMIATGLDPSAKALAAAEIVSCLDIPYEVAETQAQDEAESTWQYYRHQTASVLDTILLVARHLATEPGSRVLLMVSPGFVSGGMDRQAAAITDECVRNHIALNALDDEGLLTSAESPEALGDRTGMRANWAERTLSLRTQIVSSFMVTATESTGGAFLHNTNDLAAGMRALAAAPAVSYLLGFSPGQPDGKYHKLKVTLARPGDYQIAARPGYVATRPADRAESAQERIDRVVSSSDSLDQAPATVSVSSSAAGNGLYRIQVRIALDARRLPFGSQKGASLQQLTFVTVIQDASGNYMNGKEAVMDMLLTAAKRADLESKGIKATTFFIVPPGSYRIREVIREAVHNRVSASTSPIDIR